MWWILIGKNLRVVFIDYIATKCKVNSHCTAQFRWMFKLWSPSVFTHSFWSPKTLRNKLAKLLNIWLITFGRRICLQIIPKRFADQLSRASQLVQVWIIWEATNLNWKLGDTVFIYTTWDRCLQRKRGERNMNI